MSKVYLVTFDASPPVDLGAVHARITSLMPGLISDWWHYFSTTYIVVSELDISTLYNNIFPCVPMKNLFIIEIQPSNVQGWLPKSAWEWLRKYAG